MGGGLNIKRKAAAKRSAIDSHRGGPASSDACQSNRKNEARECLECPVDVSEAIEINLEWQMRWRDKLRGWDCGR